MFNSLTHASVHRGLLQHRLLPYMAPVGLGPPPELANFLVKGDPKASIKRVESWSFIKLMECCFSPGKFTASLLKVRTGASSLSQR